MISPSPTENGTFARFTIAKNHAAVPRNSFTGNRDARKYIDMTGPAGVRDHRGEAAQRAVGRGGDPVRPRRPRPARANRRRSRVIAITASRITPMIRFTHASSANARNATPSSSPTTTAGASRRSARQLACRR